MTNTNTADDGTERTTSLLVGDDAGIEDIETEGVEHIVQLPVKNHGDVDFDGDSVEVTVIDAEGLE